jgi:hypothetical protein
MKVNYVVGQESCLFCSYLENVDLVIRIAEYYKMDSIYDWLFVLVVQTVFCFVPEVAFDIIK